MIKRIAVVGATGMVGAPVTKILADSGFEVTALVRDVAKAKKRLPDVISLIEGDVYDFPVLKKLMAGQDAVFISLNLQPGERKNDLHAETHGLENVLEAGRRAGIKSVAFVSSMVMNYQGMNGFSWWVFDLKREAVDTVKASGIPYTLFYPSTFIENFEGNYRKGNRIVLAGKSVAKMHFISAEDFGRQVARSFQVSTGENKEHVVQGPEAFTADEAADEYIRHYKKEKLSTLRVPFGVLRFLGRFSAKIDYGVHIVEALNNYPEKFEAQATWDELGKPTVTIREFAKNASPLRS